MTISLRIAPSVIVSAKKINVRPRISAVITSIIPVPAVPAVHVAYTSRQKKNGEKKDKRVT